jgi:predicted nucleotidyltransferase
MGASASTPQQHFLDSVVPRIAGDPRVAGVAVAGSLATGAGDEFSDVDLVVAVHHADYDEVMADRLALIASWAPLVIGFTGEHVGEPRVIIALVGPPLLHVDVKFVRLSDFGERIADPRLVHDPRGLLAGELAAHPLDPAPFDVQWIEDRFWVWVHYAATKLGRGELYEVLDLLAFVRGTVLGPLAALRAGVEPRGVRRLEQDAPLEAAELRTTVCRYDPDEAVAALRASIALYRRWIGDHAVARRALAEELAVQYLDEVATRAPAALR